MKRCLVCNAQFSSMLRDCTTCGSFPAIVDGFDAYAPDLAHAGGGFEAEYFGDLARLEDGNFWFKARNKIIIWALEKYAPDFKSLLEIGCGTGFVLNGVANSFPQAKIFGSEIFTAGLEFAAGRLPTANLMQMDARHIPFVDEFDVIGAFDVLEHIKEDEIALDQIHKALKPHGLVILTVPQHAWLWSAVDEYACHERRYSSSEVADKVMAAGFEIVRSTSFVTTLLPAMMISRAFQKRRSESFDAAAEMKISPVMNSLFEQLLSLELACIRLGMNFPVGGSRLVLAKKV